MKRLALLINVIAPYRLPIYASLAESFDTWILHGGTEPNRSWKVDLPSGLNVQRVFTLQLKMRKKNGIAGVSDVSYVHLNLGLLWRLVQCRPDIIVSIEMGLRTICAVIYGKLAHVPVWVWWGGTLHSERNIPRMKVILRRFLVRHVKRWISYGATTTEYLESIGISREQILQIQNCVPQETFQVAPSKPTDRFNGRPRPLIVSVGQLVQRKGYDKLIEACGRLAARNAQFSLVIVGQGPERDRLQALAKENGIEHFEILPDQSQSDLNEIYRSADVFMFPTLEDIWGLVVNEAMWAGTPVLCSKYAGCAAELLPESNVFDPMSPASFDAALARVLERTLCPPDRSKLLTWQEVSLLMRRSLDSGTPAR